jgi:hypothetical protein
MVPAGGWLVTLDVAAGDPARRSSPRSASTSATTAPTTTTPPITSAFRPMSKI